MNPDLQTHLTNGRTWTRLLLMLLFGIALEVAKLVTFLLAFIQIIFALTTGKSNLKVRTFGGQLALYMAQITNYLTYCSNDKPFPFADWPQSQGCSGGTHEEHEDEWHSTPSESRPEKSATPDSPAPRLYDEHDTPAT